MRGLEQIPWLYDASLWLLERSGLRRWRAWLTAGARGRTLDLGCGTGRNLPYPAGTLAIGLDPDAANLLRARRRAPGVPLVVALAEGLPFKDGSFDTVVSSLVLCSVQDPAAALAEARRVLKPGGELRLMEHVRSHRPWQAWLQDRLQPFWTRLSGGCHLNRETERAVEAAGFEILPEGRRARGVMRRFAARRGGG